MKKDFTILGIESTCDETSAAVLRGGEELLSNVVYSQIDEHKKYHGVVPELASRAHAAKIAAVIETALGGHHIDCVAFASGPGLPEEVAAGRLAVGVGVQQEAVPIVYGEEIPILVRTFRDQSELFVYDAARDFADPSRFEGDLFTEAYTVTFSDVMPEESSPAA